MHAYVMCVAVRVAVIVAVCNYSGGRSGCCTQRSHANTFLHACLILVLQTMLQ